MKFHSLLFIFSYVAFFAYSTQEPYFVFFESNNGTVIIFDAQICRQSSPCFAQHLPPHQDGHVRLTSFDSTIFLLARNMLYQEERLKCEGFQKETIIRKKLAEEMKALPDLNNYGQLLEFANFTNQCDFRLIHQASLFRLGEILCLEHSSD